MGDAKLKQMTRLPWAAWQPEDDSSQHFTKTDIVFCAGNFTTFYREARQKPHERGSALIVKFQVKTLKLREVKSLAQGHTAVTGWS